MSKLPYVHVVGCLMYLMVCVRLDEESKYMFKVPYVYISLGGHELCRAKSLNFIFYINTQFFLVFIYNLGWP